MIQSLKILHIEDVHSDAELVERTLKRSEITFEKLVVDTKEDYTKALDEFNPDIILSDHSLPSFNSLDALQILKQTGRNIPFILITATVSEEFAVSVMKEGASDYMLKDRLQRLPGAVLNAVGKCRSDNERKAHLDEIFASEELFTKAELLAEFGTWRFDFSAATTTTTWSAGTYKLLGYKQGEVEPSHENFLKNVHPDDVIEVERIFKNAFTNFQSVEGECRIMNKDGSIRYLRTQFEFELDEKGKPAHIIGFNQDVTRSKLAKIEIDRMTADLVQRNNDLEKFAYIISHNLRAPVANIIGASDILNNIELSPQEKEKLSMGINISVRRLDEVISDLNQILQVKSGVDEIKETVLFSELVEHIKISIMNLIDKNNIEIKYDFSGVNEFFVLKAYLYSIFFNLISNSIKYRRQQVHSIIEIRSRLQKNKIELTFTDNGMGIDLIKNGDQVFGLYKRFHSNIEGKGMGLFMVKTQVETLGGKISVKSEENKGTEFKIEFKA
jgi:signal transduction histidine kinase/DNA-binding response OmpR family regulator